MTLLTHLAQMRRSRLVSTSLLLALLMGCLTGCSPTQKKQAQDLVQAGSTDADQLATYYTTLAQERIDYLSLFTLRLKRTTAPLDPGLSASIATQVDALEARSNMASSLKAAYDKLGKLIDYDATTEVGGAVDQLRQAIENANHHPLTLTGFPIPVDIDKLLRDAVSHLVEVQQVHEFRRKAVLVRAVLDAVKQVFDAEKTIYVQISQDYATITYQTAEYLVKNGEATGSSVFQKFIAPYGLQPREPATPDPTVTAWILDRLKDQLDQQKKLAQDTADALSASLLALIQAHDDLMHRRKPKTDEMNTSAQATQKRLDDLTAQIVKNR